ncbi:hypothetical protein [Bradyrhizobium sp.]|nr:hypothetical protein [Bradyrhizobium sp.]
MLPTPGTPVLDRRDERGPRKVVLDETTGVVVSVTGGDDDDHHRH